MKIKAGSIYLDPQTRQFFLVRVLGGRHWACGSHHEYYGDAASNPGTPQYLSAGYIKSCQKVGAIDQVPGIVRNKYGWRMEDAEPAPVAPIEDVRDSIRELSERGCHD